MNKDKNSSFLTKWCRLYIGRRKKNTFGIDKAVPWLCTRLAKRVFCSLLSYICKQFKIGTFWPQILFVKNLFNNRQYKYIESIFFSPHALFCPLSPDLLGIAIHSCVYLSIWRDCVTWKVLAGPISSD